MKRKGPVLVVALLAAALLALLVYGVARQGDDTTLDKAVSQGARPAAPDRAMPALNGHGERSLAQYRGKVVVLNFWASWCDPCRAEAPILRAAHERLTRNGQGTVLGATYQDATARSLSFLREFRIDYPNARDVDTKLAKRYGTVKLPETFVIDRKGRIAAIGRGQLNRRFLERAIDIALRS
jgi:cytochrome c biogenesis protein CcmG/thiol:disulfide interchange protein DsbE